MACRGVVFAITDETAKELLAASDDDAVMAIIERVEEEWNKAYLAETDKAWDAMHRALSDGTLDPTRGSFPLNRVILGGLQLHRGPSYIVALVPSHEVLEIARAVAQIDETQMRERYERLVPRDYAPEYGEEDRDYTAGYFVEVADLYQRAAREGRAVVFTVDQ